MISVSFIKKSSNEVYSYDSLKYINSLSKKINDIAKIVGISSGAIGGAMAEENTSYELKDAALDDYAKLELDPMIYKEKLPYEKFEYLIDLSDPAPLIEANKTGNGNLRSHLEWEMYYNQAKDITHIPTLLDKILNPSLIDAGPGNFKISVAIEMIVKYANKPEYIALNLMQYLTNYTQLVTDLMDYDNNLTAKLYAVYMKEHAEPFFKNNKAYADQWDRLPATLRDALLVTYTNMGETKMSQLMGKNNPNYEPQPGLLTGGGANHLLNASAIGKALGLVGYGDDVIAVENFKDQAKQSGPAGLAARYALQKLRYIAIDGIDYTDKNLDGSLDIFDPITGQGTMTESYINDKSAMLSWRIKQLKEGGGTGNNPLSTKYDAHFNDLGTGISIYLKNKAMFNRQILFGSKEGETLNGGSENDRLYGMEGNDTLGGGNGADYLEGGSGNDLLNGDSGNDNDTLYGGLGNDIYIFGNGAGEDVIRDQDATPGNQDQMLIGPDVAADQLWFRQLGMDLELSIIGSSDKATISNWFAGSEFQIERFQLSSGQALINQQVDSLIQAMAAFAPPAPGQTSLPADYHNALTPVIAANWQ